MSKYLDGTGLGTLWNKIKSSFVAQEDGKSLSTNDYTDAEKEKLAGITESADAVSFSQTLTSGTESGKISINGTETSVYAPTNTDTKVTNTLATTTKAYVTGTTSASTNTGTQVFDTGVYLGTTAGTLHATTFDGALSGNATTATSATTATKLGSSTVGSSVNPIYLSSGTATASSSTIGSSATPVYLNSGTLTACSGAYKKWNYGSMYITSDNSAPYFKIAEITLATSYQEACLSMKVTSGRTSVADGILRIQVRTGNDPTSDAPTSATISWEYYSGYSTYLENFILAYCVTSSGTVVEFWYKSPSTYTGMMFYVLNEAGTYMNPSQSAWTLYQKTGTEGATEIDSAYTQKTSTLLTIKNPISDLTDSGWISAASLNSTYVSSGTVEYRTIGKQIYVTGKITLGADLPTKYSNTPLILVTLISGSTIVDYGSGGAGFGGIANNSAAGAKAAVFLTNYTGGTYITGYAIADAISSGTTLYFSVNGLTT